MPAQRDHTRSGCRPTPIRSSRHWLPGWSAYSTNKGDDSHAVHATYRRAMHLELDFFEAALAGSVPLMAAIAS